MVKVIEVTETVGQEGRLRLDIPVPGVRAGQVKVRLSVDDGADTTPEVIPPAATLEEFMERIRLLNEEFPCPSPRTTAEWMRELREGEER